MTAGGRDTRPVLDEEVVEELRAVGGRDSTAFLRELVGELLDQATMTIAFCEGSDAGAAAIATRAHKLKGAAGTVGAMRLSAAAEALERGAHETHRRRELVQGLRSEMDAFRARSAAAIRGTD